MLMAMKAIRHYQYDTTEQGISYLISDKVIGLEQKVITKTNVIHLFTTLTTQMAFIYICSFLRQC